MAKSIRSKAKRSFRAKKREDGIYAATEAARLHRLSTKLATVTSKDADGDVPIHDSETGNEDMPVDEDDVMNPAPGVAVIEGAPAGRVSTHGPRNSRREEWRASKGMVPRPKREGMNRQGGVAGRRKAGRSKRRR